MKPSLTFIFALLLASIGLTMPSHIVSYDTLPLNHMDFWLEVSTDGEIDAEYEYLSELTFVRLTYESDEEVVEGFMVSPTHATKLPIVLFNRGGNSNFARITDPILWRWLAPIARAGYAVFASQYREQDEYGGADVHDVLNLLDIAKEFGHVDSSRIGMVGWSRGGIMTCLALCERSDIDCAILGSSPARMDWVVEDRPGMDTLLQHLIPDYAINRDSALFLRSPALRVADMHPTPLLILHGGADQRLPVKHALLMSAALQAVDHPHELHIMPDDDHLLSAHAQEKEALILAWLDRYLIPRID